MTTTLHTPRSIFSYTFFLYFVHFILKIWCGSVVGFELDMSWVYQVFWENSVGVSCKCFDWNSIFPIIVLARNSEDTSSVAMFRYDCFINRYIIKWHLLVAYYIQICVRANSLSVHRLEITQACNMYEKKFRIVRKQSYICWLKNLFTLKWPCQPITINQKRFYFQWLLVRTQRTTPKKKLNQLFPQTFRFTKKKKVSRKKLSIVDRQFLFCFCVLHALKKKSGFILMCFFSSSHFSLLIR